MTATQGNGALATARDWARALASYRRPSAARGFVELVVTVLPYVAAWAAMLIAAHNGQLWLSFAMAPIAAALLARLFMIQHDCGHGGLFPAKPANDWVGRAIGVVTMTPYDHWRRLHAIHHATSGNLARRGIGDIKTLTVREYFARRWRDRLCYRLYRHPLVMFGLGPLYVFLIENRLPFGFMRKGAMPWLSTMTTNAGILVAAGLLIWLVGLTCFIVVSCRSSRSAAPSPCGSSTCSINSTERRGILRPTGASPRRRCTAVPITTCRRRSPGSRATSACITCIICRAAFRSTVFPTC